MIVISASTSECREIFTLNLPKDFISLTGCIIDGLISILPSLKINFDISVGLTDPYNSLFSVLNFLTLYSFLSTFSEIFLASCFFSLSFFESSDLIFSTCLIFSFDA